MQKILSLLVLSLVFTNVFSQQYQVTAQFKNATNNENIPYLYVQVYNQNDSLMLSSIADEKGFVTMKLMKGTYKLTFQQIGYENDTMKLQISENKFLGTIKLKPSDAEISEITVSAKSHKTLIDKDIQVITKDKKEGAANTYDVLERVQGLSYDRYNQKIKVDNSDNIIILVNGIEKDAEYIKNINPDRLLKVEVIRSPSGKYAIAGYQAIINIILKDNFRGYEVNVNNNLMVDYSKNSEAPIPIDFTYASFEHTNKNINVYANYFVNFFDFKVSGTKERTYANGDVELYQKPNNQKNMRLASLMHNGVVGVDWTINPKNVISTEFKAAYVPLKTNNMSSSYIINTLNIPVTTSQKSENTTYTAKLYYIGNYSEKSNITASFIGSIYNNSTDYIFGLNNIEDSQNTKDSKKYGDFSLEFNYSFTDKLSLNVGNQEIMSLLDNSNISNNNTQQTFNYSDIRIRNYIYMSYKPVKMIGLKIGTAYEIAILDNKQLSKSFSIWMPHVDINFKPHEMVEFTAKYRSKSNYPSIDQLNPFSKYEDINSISTGNPNLKPANENRISIRLNALQGLLSAEPYYKFTNNYIIQTIDKDQNGKYIFRYENAGKYTDKGFSGNLTIPFAKFLILQNNVDIYKQAIVYEGETRDLKHWTMSSNLIYINNKYSTVVGLLFQKELYKNLNWLGYNSWNNDFWGCFVQQPFFKKQLNVMVLAFLPINLWVNFNQGSFVKNVFYQESNNINIDILKSLLMFQISYRFNKGKEISKIEKNQNEPQDNQQKKLF